MCSPQNLGRKYGVHKIQLESYKTRGAMTCIWYEFTTTSSPVARMIARSFSLAAGSCLNRAFNRKLWSRLNRTNFTAPVVSLLSPSSFNIVERSNQCSSCHMVVRKIRSSMLRSQDTSSWKSTGLVRILRELKWLPLEVWTLSELEWDRMREETWIIAAPAASPSWAVLDERPSSSMIAGTGTIIVHWLFSRMDASDDNEDKRMLVSMTSII